MRSLVLDFYERSLLFEKVRPKADKEGTVLAAFVKEQMGEFGVVSLATGTKSVPKSCMNIEGWVLNDCHAEILAGRGLLKYLYSEVENAKNGKESILNEVAQSFEISYKLKKDVSIHLYISEPPCGDASMLHKQYDEDKESGETIYWTGAKACSEGAKSSLDVGITRLKCGRSDI